MSKRNGPKGEQTHMARSLITTKEVAKRTRKTESTIRYWRHVGKGPRGVRLGGGRQVLYDEAEVDAWIDAQFGRSPD